MAMVTLGEAARLTGLGKTTLARAIKAGRLSATRTEAGSYEIDPAELSRVYPFPAPREATGATVAATGPAVRHATLDATSETPPDTKAVLDAQLAGLREVAELLRRQLEDVREDRDRWRGQAESAQRLITHGERRSWWRRLAG
jgi:excisionase family DNA binding protein